MPEEYTGPNRCDLCEYEDEAPCPGKKCGIMHEYDAFELKGEGSEEDRTLFVSYHFYASYSDGNIHSDYGNIFLSADEPKNEEDLGKVTSLIHEDIKNRIGFKEPVVIVLNFKDLT